MVDEGENQASDSQASDRDMVDWTLAIQKKRELRGRERENRRERERSCMWTFSYHSEIKPESSNKM